MSTDDYQSRLAEIRTRTQAARHCTICDPMGYLPGGGLCHHNPDQTPSAERIAAKARARAAIAEARRKAAHRPEQDQTDHEESAHA